MRNMTAELLLPPTMIRRFSMPQSTSNRLLWIYESINGPASRLPWSQEESQHAITESCITTQSSSITNLLQRGCPPQLLVPQVLNSHEVTARS